MTIILTLVSLAIFQAACGGSRSSGEGEAGEPGEAASVEDSGSRLSGDYELRSEQDEYSNKSAQGEPGTTFRFKEDGTFSIQKAIGTDASIIEEGTYLITKQGELVLYIEKIAGNPRSDARIARYQIDAQTQNTLKLERNPSSSLVLEKK